MEPPAYPLAFGHWHVQGNQLTCRLPRKTVEVAAPGPLLRAVLRLCDGRLGWREVAAELAGRWSAKSVDAFLSQLFGEGLLVEASESLAHWTELGQLPALHCRIAPERELPALHRVAQGRLLPGRTPSALPLAAAGLAELLRGRESYRTFADEPLAADTLCAILWSAHGVAKPAEDPALQCHRTVASGGNMHSARWFVYVLRELPGSDAPMLAGLYEARYHREGGASLQALSGAFEDAWRMVLDPRVLRFASALVLPVFDITVPARKYGNRATLFATLEAGQCLQNAQLMATALGAAGMLRGDTSAAAVLEALGPHLRRRNERAHHWLAMPALVLGLRPSGAEVMRQRGDARFQVTAGVRLPAVSRDGAGSFAFTAGPITVGDGHIHASGRASDPRLALDKAQAEAWERLAWATLGKVEEGVCRDLDGALDPRCLVAYSPAQHARPGFPLRPFSPRRSYLWTAATEVFSGRRVLVPAECVHALSALPARHRARACTNSSTSGVAAWTDAEGALCRATLELIERDAFLRAWLGRRPPPRIVLRRLPADARRSIARLRAAGCSVSVSLLDAPVPVFSVSLRDDRRPFAAITTAAEFAPDAALTKALDEAEGRLAHAIAFPAEPLRRASDVQGAHDVNRFYQTRRFFRNADFWERGSASTTFAENSVCSDWQALKAWLAAKRRDLLAVDLTPEGAALDQGRRPLFVMRAFVPGLLPIWFQHGLQPTELPAFQAALAQRRPRGNAAFVHPFT